MQAAPDRHEKLRDELQTLFQSAKLPSSPAIAKKILGLIDDPYSTAQQFAQLIEADPALAARLLKMANSARYAQRQKVTTIQRSVTVIGLGQLRVVALGFELVSHLDRLGAASFCLRTFWQQAVFRASLAREVALKVVPSLAEEAFLVGLLQDCGVLPLVQALGRDYAECFRHEHTRPAAFYAAERKHFPYTHVDAIAALASMWQLPETIATPLATHHKRVRLGARSPEEAKLCGVSYLVGSCGFDGDRDDVPIEPSVLAYLREDLHLDEKALRECLATSRESYSQLSQMVQEDLSDDLDVTELLVVANRHLQRQAAESEDRIRAVEADRDQVLDEQVTLRSALGQYREQAARDPLTGLLNRRAVLDAAAACIHRVHENQSTVTVMFLDVDNFKTINDTFGHHAGDEVLKAVALAVGSAVGAIGIAGRYGGEEFIAIVPDLSEEDAREHAERLLAAIRAAQPEGVRLPGPITASLGAVWCRLHAAPAARSLISEADKLMYVAKRGGKDHCCFRAISVAGLEPIGDEQRPSASSRDERPPGSERRTTVPEDLRHAAVRLQEREQSTSGRPPNGQQWLLVPCALRCLNSFSNEMCVEQALVWSISAEGLGLVMHRPLVRGDVVEIAIELGGRKLYLAGLVTDCRTADGTAHDIVIQQFQRSDRPILTASDQAITAELERAHGLIDAHGGVR